MIEGFWRVCRSRLMAFSSNYGRSFARPLSLLAATVFAGTFLILVGCWTPALTDIDHTGQAFGLSFANTFGVLGIRKEFTRLCPFLGRSTLLAAASEGTIPRG